MADVQLTYIQDLPAASTISNDDLFLLHQSGNERSLSITALLARVLSRENPFGDIKADGNVDTALANLGLGEAAKLPAATGYLAYSGWLKIPLLDRKSVIIQWGMFSVTATLSSSSGVKAYDGQTTFNYPIAFPNAALMVNASPMDSEETFVETATVDLSGNSVATLRLGGVSAKTDLAKSVDFRGFVVAIGY